MATPTGTDPRSHLRPVVAAASLILGLALLMRFVDRPLALYFEPRHDALQRLAEFLTRFGQAPWYLVPATALFLVYRFLRHDAAAAARMLFVFLSVAVPGLLVDLIKGIIGRARPWELFNHGTYGFSPLQFNANYQSFPSGHTACAVGVGVALAILVPRWRALFLAAGAAVALTRVIVAAHYLSDVLGAAVLSWVVVHALERRFIRYGLLPRNASRLEPAAPRPDFLSRLVGLAAPSEPG